MALPSRELQSQFASGRRKDRRFQFQKCCIGSLPSLLEQIFGFDPAPYLIVTLFLHAASMLVPFKMPFLIRSLTKSPVAIGMVNVALLLAWLWPFAAPIVAASFFVTYLSSFFAGTFRWLRTADSDGLP